MNTSQEVELRSIVEALPDEELAPAAAAFLQEWCERRGASQPSIEAFMGRFVDTQMHDYVRYVVRELLADGPPD